MLHEVKLFESLTDSAMRSSMSSAKVYLGNLSEIALVSSLKILFVFLNQIYFLDFCYILPKWSNRNTSRVSLNKKAITIHPETLIKACDPQILQKYCLFISFGTTECWLQLKIPQQSCVIVQNQFPNSITNCVWSGLYIYTEIFWKNPEKWWDRLFSCHF